MKYSILFILLLLVTSCGNSETNDSTDSATADNEEVVKKESVKTLEPLGDPCQIPASEIASILGWNDYSEGRANAINGENLKACDYSSKLQGGLSISFQRYNYSSDGNELEQSFRKALEKSSEKITYQEISEGFGDQAIYYFGKNGLNYTYYFEWRIGNHTINRLYLRSPKELNSEEKLEQLQAIAKKL